MADIHDIRTILYETSPMWLPDSYFNSCYLCDVRFDIFNRRHHCRNCGNIICRDCSQKRTKIPALCYNKAVRICDKCYPVISATVTINALPIRLKIKIAEYLDPVSFCRLSSISFEYYRIFTSEELDQYINIIV